MPAGSPRRASENISPIKKRPAAPGSAVRARGGYIKGRGARTQDDRGPSWPAHKLASGRALDDISEHFNCSFYCQVELTGAGLPRQCLVNSTLSGRLASRNLRSCPRVRLSVFRFFLVSMSVPHVPARESHPPRPCRAIREYRGYHEPRRECAWNFSHFARN